MSNYNLKKTTLAISKIKQDKIDEAEIILSELNNSKSYFSAAIELEKINNLDFAIEFYDKSIEIDENYLPAFVNKSKIIEKKGNIISAIKCLESSLNIKTNLHYITYYNLGLLYSKILNYKSKTNIQTRTNELQYSNNSHQR